jgi:NAD-dependent deacetylase sirtuin 5
MKEFLEVVSKAKHIAVITGAGVSAESGVPTFKGDGGQWKTWQYQVICLICKETSMHGTKS